MNSRDPKGRKADEVNTETGTLFPVSSIEGVFELIDHYREALNPAMSSVQRGKVHLELGRQLATLGKKYQREAAEELRQALELLPDDSDTEAHAITRFELGRLLLEGQMLEEARVHLERARALALVLNDEALRIESALLLSVAHCTVGQRGLAYAVLEDERLKASNSLRYRVDFLLAHLWAGEALASMREKGLALVGEYLKQGMPHPPEIESALIGFLGEHHRILGVEMQALALSWLDSLQPITTSIIFIGSALRRQLFPKDPNRWMEAGHREMLVSTMRDSRIPLRERFQAGYMLLGNLPAGERSLNREVVESLDTWRNSPEIEPMQGDIALHDLATSMLQLAEQEAIYFERAIPLYERALAIVPERDRPITWKSLLNALLGALEVRAKVSSPALLPMVKRIDDLVLHFQPSERVSYYLHTASLLLTWQEMTHPECLQAAEKRLEKALGLEPENPDALRMVAWKDWIRYQQGTRSKEEAENSLGMAREFGPVEVFRSPSGLVADEVKGIAEFLAKRRRAEGVSFEHFEQIARFRPDVVELILEALESGTWKRAEGARQRVETYRSVAAAINIATEGEPGERGRRLAKLVVQELALLNEEDLRLLDGILRGPASESFRAELQRQGHPIRIEESEKELLGTPEEQAQRLQQRALEDMQKGRVSASSGKTEEAVKHFQAAISALDRALFLVKRSAPARRAMLQISAGNARRHLAKVEDLQAHALLQEAERMYREALPWAKGDLILEPQCKKVLADCIIQQKQSSRWQEAMDLYQDALKGRPGGFRRMETLLAVAEAELLCSSRERHVNLRKALGRLEEAIPHIDKGENDKRKMLGQMMLNWLSELARSPLADPSECNGFADKIRELWPDLADKAHAALRGLGGSLGHGNDGMGDAMRLLFDSGFMPVFLEAVRPISDRVRTHQIPEHMREAVHKILGEYQDLRNDPEALRRRAEQLQMSNGPENHAQKAARLIGRTRVLGALRALGKDVRADLEQAAQEAEQAAEGIEDLGIRAFALSELSKTWGSLDSGRDFVRSAALMEKALAILPENDRTLRAELLGNFARATRYRDDLSPREAIERAIPMYQLSIELNRGQGNLEGVVIGLQNLAEALASRQDRPKAQALGESIALERKAIVLARSIGGEPLGRLLGNLAYALTRLAEELPRGSSEEGECLVEAGKLFEEADPLVKEPVLRVGLEGNRLIWASRMNPSGNTTIAALRERLKAFSKETQPREWACAAHNLAYELFEKSLSVEEKKAGLWLYRQALALRPLDTQPELHWETAQSLGAVLVRSMELQERGILKAFGLTPISARKEAEQYLKSAIQAARKLGNGRSLIWSAKWLGYLATTVKPGELPDLTMTATALEILAEILSLSPDDRESALAEAEIATRVAALLAIHRAQNALIQGITETGSTVLYGSAAWEILHWMLRARGGLYRRLKMRLLKPDLVRPEIWTQWRLALRGKGNWEERRLAAEALQLECPSFLKDESSLDGTVAWINETQGAAATLLETPFGLLLGVITHGEKEPAAHIVLVKGEFPFLSSEQVLPLLRAPGSTDDPDTLAKALHTLGQIETVLRGPIASALESILPEATRALLWSPHGIAAAAPLGSLWSKVSTIWTTPCITRPPPRPSVPQSALMVLADPKPPGEQGTIPDGVKTMRALSQTFHNQGIQADVLMGCGPIKGALLLQVMHGEAVPGLLPLTGPSPDELLARLSEHRWIVLLAHGTYDAKSPDQSYFELLDAQGKIARLTAEMLAKSPDLLRDATLLLLSCEAGVSGELSVAPEGLAGVILTLGARVVIAPMRLVKSNVAMEVGEQLCKAASRGDDMAFALHQILEKVVDTRGIIDDVKDILFGAGSFVVWTG